ncbi:MAG: hypothetical protein H0V30_11610 [Chitinophagaceae bacterium]|nr:hypothetical protein [Chitinophagaceae bacterium]
MKIKIICSLRHCKLPENPFQFKFSYFNLLPGQEHLDSAIFNNHLYKQIGNINIREFINKPFFFSFLEIKDKEDFTITTTKTFSALNALSSFIWFAKDNCIDAGLMYSYYADVDDIVLSRYKIANTSNANGEYSETLLNLEDIELAEKIFLKVTELQNNKPDKKKAPELVLDLTRPIISDTNYHYQDYNENNRIQRALSFLVMARSNSFLPLKISIYIAILETVFTTDSTEVNYKVCQRAAFYLGGDAETKFANFQKVKEAYDIRSKFFHGQELAKNKDKRENLASVSVEIDNIVRKVLTKVLFDDSEIFLKDNTFLNSYYNKLVFK